MSGGGRFDQWEDIVLEPASGDLVRDVSGNLFTGTAKLYLASPSDTVSSVTPVDVTITAGVWSYEFTADESGYWLYEIRVEGSTHGTSGVKRFRVNPSPFAAPATPTP